MRFGLLGALALSLSLAAVTACSSDGGGGGGPEIDAYVTSYLAAQRQANNALAYVPTPAFDDDANISEAERESIQANYEGNVQLTRDFRNLVADITPPASLGDEHEVFLAALDAQIAYRDSFTGRYGQAQTVQDLQDLSKEVLDSDEGRAKQEALDSACHDLRNASRGASATIICGDE